MPEGQGCGAISVGEEKYVTAVGEVMNEQEVIAGGRDFDGGPDADFAHQVGDPGGEVILVFVGGGEERDAVGVIFPDVVHGELDGDTALDEVFEAGCGQWRFADEGDFAACLCEESDAPWRR